MIVGGDNAGIHTLLAQSQNHRQDGSGWPTTKGAD
jgi:hypothetical protein